MILEVRQVFFNAKGESVRSRVGLAEQNKAEVDLTTNYV